MSTSAQLLQPLPGVIEPRWWTGTPALPVESFTIDCADYAMDAGDLDKERERAQRMNALFDEIGLVCLVNTRLAELPAMREFAKLVIADEMRYKGGANPRDNLTKSVYEVGAPLEAWLHYHHEMAYVGHSTCMLGFLCHKALPDRGYTFVSDNLRATDAILETEFGQKLKRLGICYHRNLTDREAYAGMWFDSWPKVMHLPYDERPLKLTFGDDTEMTREEKQLFVDVYDRFGIPIPWNAGDIAVVCNYRFAHGRPGIRLEDGEERELGVVIGGSFERVGDLPDKW